MERVNTMSFNESVERIFSANALERYIPLSPALEQMTALLLEFNAHTNLTAITEPEEMILKHYADCLVMVGDLPENARLMDVGAGGGFPSLMIALARPDVRVMSLDSTAKKLAFIDWCAGEMGMNNISTLNARAEDVGKNSLHREKYDVVCARAVARLNILSELCLPLVKKGGKFIALKGAGGEEEIDEARKGIAVLGGNLTENRRITLTDGKESFARNLIFVQKNAPAPKNYPRNYAQISKKPL